MDYSLLWLFTAVATSIVTNFIVCLMKSSLSMQDRSVDAPTEGPTSSIAVINRVLRKIRPRHWWLHEVRSSIVVRLLIHISAYVANVISLYLVAHYQRFTRQILVNSLGIIFQMAITVLIWFYLYKSLGIMMIKIHFEVYPLFVLDTRFCWNTWKSQ